MNQAYSVTDQKAVPAPGAGSRILIVDDETLFARAVRKRLEKAGHACVLAERLSAARELLASQPPDLILLDLRLPDGGGLDFLARLAADGLPAPVIVLTAYGEVSDAVSAMKLGALDYLKKPLDLEELVIVVDKAMQNANLRHRLDYSRERDTHAMEGAQMLGESEPIRRVRAQIERLAQLQGEDGTSPTVLIQGETGTGKDLAARMLHLAGPKRALPFVQVDCASLPRELIEAELFGHEKGAFTSAHGARTGLIEAAEDGTLFLDEIAELPLELQAKLLNVIERRILRRVGSVRERPVPARFVAATNRMLPELIGDGRFRPDLYYRLNVVTLEMPPLRSRGEDVPLLARHYARQTSRRYGLSEPQFDPDAQTAIRTYPWPGNVRELKHLVERAVLLCRGGVIRVHDLALSVPELPRRDSAGELEGLTLDQAERLMIDRALAACGGNVSEAARRLGVSRMTMRYRMEKHGLRAPGL